MEVTVEIVNNIDECMEKIQNKTLRGFSIGWRCLDCVYKEEGNKYIREITKLDLAEISVVAVPANPSTLFTLAKSLKKFFDEKDDKGDEPEPIPAEKAEEVSPSETETPESTEAEELPNEESKEEDKEAPVETTGEVETTEETPAEVPTETPTEDVPTDTSEVVKADEEPSEEDKTALLEEVKALLLETVDKKCGEVIAQNLELRKSLDTLNQKFAELENDVLAIEVRPGNRKSVKSSRRVLTYGDL